MKTAHISTPTHEIMLVEAPEGITNVEFHDNQLYLMFKKNVGGSVSIIELKGDYEILGFVTDLKESEVVPLVEKIMQGQHFQNYKARQSGVSEWSNALWCRTALESFLSLLETKVVWENPVKVHTWASENADVYYKQWKAAEGKTFDKARTIVLVKER